MTRLQRELHRLFQLPLGQELPSDQPALVDEQGRVRAMVLALASPADWDALARVWNGVQADLGWPAPAIAVAGAEHGYQLWFSLTQPLDGGHAQALGQALKHRYLADQPAHRVRVWPQLVDGAMCHARGVPALVAADGPWSAFVAADLAPVFADEPWLELPPNPDGQASLLAALRSMSADELVHGLALLDTARPNAAAPATPGQALALAAHTDPRRFLLEVMNNEAVALSLRIDAAKALLPYADLSSQA